MENESSQRTCPGVPNVVLIFMDDMTHWALGAVGGQIETPNLDRLASRGTTFTHAVNQGSWTGAVCVASRAMLLTGQSVFHARDAIDAVSSQRPPSLGEVLGSAGYETLFTGKWHNAEHTLRRSYQRVGPYDGAMLFPDRLPDGSDDIGRPAEGNTWDPSDAAAGGHWMRVDDAVVHSSERWANAGIEFLNGVDRANGGDRPFFLHIAFHAPHDPRQAPRRWVDRYPPSQIDVPPNFLPAHPFDQGDRHVRDELLAPFPRTRAAIQLHRSEYSAIVSHADEQVGRVLDELDRLGMSDDTIVVFSGDHGLALGEHGLMGKQCLYDHSIRVPLIFAGPGIPSGKLNNQLVYQASIFATLSELLGLKLPAGIDFASLVPAFSGVDPATGGGVFGAYRDLQRLIRTPDWALIAYRHARRMQLFDMRHDPWQMHDLSADPAHSETVQRLLADLSKLQDRYADPFGSWTQEVDASWSVHA